MFVWTLALLLLVALGLLFYWLLIVTEGVYLGRRFVVWLYDLTAHHYDAIKQFDEGVEQFFVVRPLLRTLSHHPAPLILDVATGTGRLPLFLLETPTFNGRVIGLDASAKMLGYAARKLRPFGHRAALVQQTADALPFATNTFEAISCLESLEFFPDDVAALCEMVRVLRPGGTLLVTRRRGWEAKTFLGRYHSQEDFEGLLVSLGLNGVQTQPWQVDYDLVFAFKEIVDETAVSLNNLS